MTADPLQPAARALWEDAVREDVPDAHAAALRAAEEHTALIVNALDTTQVAQHLALPAEAVRRSVQEGQLVGFTHERATALAPLAVRRKWCLTRPGRSAEASARWLAGLGCGWFLHQ